MKAFEYLKIKKGSLPVAEKICSEVLSLPIYAELDNNKIIKIVNLIKKYV
ncbi:MAG: DegT/DnrJ/EryC1/StrS family aminotransferase [Candidatus Shapirobacteria bacterium]|nr:DegT/DnrJ/EryC1/StrS family aminotransferase [Candidatus Shapirobacteria bacterium]